MKFKKIVGFGDSWIYGDELMDPELLRQEPDAHSCWTQNDTYRTSHCFLGLLGQHYGVPVENFGQPGGSLQSAIWNCLWWLEREPEPESCLILTGHTDNNRMTFWNPGHVSYANDPPWNKHIHSSWIHAGCDAPAEWKDMVKKHMLLTDCDELSKLNYQQSVLFFDGLAAARNINLVQFNIMVPSCQMPVPTFYQPEFDFVTWLRRHVDEKHLSCPNGHPNEAGHKRMADMLQDHIDRVILSK